MFRALAGIALAGTFMPGLKILTDAITGPKQSRWLAFYTASFSLGASASTAATGAIGHAMDATAAFIFAAIGGAAALLLVALAIQSRPQAPRPHVATWGALWQAARNRQALGYSLAYAAHMWELYGFRAWLVAYLLFAATGSLAPTGDTSYALWGAVLLLLGMPSSIIGNELALKIGRRRLIILVMCISAALALAFGAGSILPFPILLVLGAVYSMLVTADSASLTAGAVAAARPGPERRHHGAAFAARLRGREPRPARLRAAAGCRRRSCCRSLVRRICYTGRRRGVRAIDPAEHAEDPR